MSFELNGQATLESLDIRKEGPLENKHLMLDLKLWIRTDADLLAHFHATLKHFLFTDDGSPRIASLKPIALEGRMRNMELEIGGHCFHGVELGKFKFEPMDGFAVGLNFTAKLTPDGSQTAQLAEFVGDELAIDIRPQPELDLQPKSTERSQMVDSISDLHKSLEKDGASLTITKADGEVIARLGADSEEAYQAAVKLVEESKRASISHIQRHLRMGYNAAARLVERMTKEGIVGLDGQGHHVYVPKTKRRPAIKFRHPDNDQLGWTGRGKPPAWAKALMDSGRQLEAV